MPLNIIVELDHGGTGERRVLARMRITNVAGTTNFADYEVRTTDREGLVKAHRRTSEPVWVLVAKAIRAIGYKP